MKRSQLSLTMDVQIITPALWNVTLVLNEDEKSSNARTFLVDEQQLAFLRVLVDNWEKRGVR